MSKISGYAALTAPVGGDELVVVDVSDTSMAASGTTKRIAVSDLGRAFGGITLTPSGDTTGAADTTAVNAALAGVGAGGAVLLAPGQWYALHPWSLPTGVQLAGSKGGINFGSATNPTGTVINVVAGFTSSLPITSVIAMQETSTSTASAGCKVRDLAIQATSAPASVDGIAMYGAVNGLAIHGVSMNAVTGRGIAWYPGSTSNDSDGFWGDRIMVQGSGKSGIYRPPSDTTITASHVQGCGNGTGIDGAGIYVINGGNTRFDTVRADLSSGSGFYLDHSGAGGGYTDAISLVNCGTQRNAHHGVHVTNSSATGASWRDPIIISGCNFDEDGHNNGTGGAFAGIFVEGQNIVTISGSSVWQGTVDYNPSGNQGCPKYGLLTGTIGSGPTGPQVITWSGGHINYSSVTGGLPYLDSGNTSFIYFSPDMTAMPGYQPATGVVSRQGSATLAAGTVTVTNAWITNSTRTFVSIISPGTLANIGVPYVSSRGAGTMTIKSTNASDNSVVAWQLTGG